MVKNKLYSGSPIMVGDIGMQHYTMEVSLSHLPADNEYSTSLIPPLFQDDWYEGYFIPKGTMCLANIWYDSTFAFLCLKKPHYLSRSMNRDPTIYVRNNMMSTEIP